MKIQKKNVVVVVVGYYCCDIYYSFEDEGGIIDRQIVFLNQTISLTQCVLFIINCLYRMCIVYGKHNASIITLDGITIVVKKLYIYFSLENDLQR